MLLENLAPSPVELIQPVQPMQTIQPLQVTQPLQVMQPKPVIQQFEVMQPVGLLGPNPGLARGQPPVGLLGPNPGLARGQPPVGLLGPNPGLVRGNKPVGLLDLLRSQKQTGLLDPNSGQLEMQQPPVFNKTPKVVNCPMIVFHILLWIFFLADLLMCIAGLPFLVIPHLFFYISCILIICLTSPIWKYLNNKTTNKAIYETMQAHFSKAPVITLTTRSYHISGMDDDRRRWYTHEENVDFKYYSWKDVSGTFHLDLSQTNKKPIYMLLRVKNEIDFADSSTVDDYTRMKKDLYERNTSRDNNIEETEERTYEGYQEYTLVKLGKEDSCFFSKCVLVFMMMISLGIVFCWKFEKRIISQSFVVKKLVSTRHNLLEVENSVKYSQQKPMVSINSDVYEYDEQITGSVNDVNKVAPPSAEELKKAQMYEKEVTKY